MLADACAVAIEVVKCADQLASLPSAVAISPNVSKTSGTVPTILFMADDIATVVAVETGLFTSEVLSTFPKPTPALLRLVASAFKFTAARGA